MSKYFIGIDVGTGSARAGVFDETGQRLGVAAHDIRMFKPQSDFVEQSSDDIWNAVCASVKDAVAESKIAADEVRGLGFDATCSLVVLDAEDRPLTVSPSGVAEQNIIVWMDHRAIDQADRINAGRHPVLKYVGNVISPEMETPKLLWLKERLPDTWSKARRFFDLPDFLTYMATGDETRSLCSTVCKWTYLGHEQNEDAVQGKWDDSYFRSIGLGDLADEGFSRIGVTVQPMGKPIGSGLTAKAATELGLRAGTAVGVSIIDAHAGGVGMIGAALDGGTTSASDLDERLALIGGTSSCHMAASGQPRFIEGIWGPYYSAMIPGMWLTEGGQSATGSLIDLVIGNHASTAELKRIAESGNKTVYEVLNDKLQTLSQGLPFPALLTKELHVSPYFHGNRSPWADPSLRGMISGLQLSHTLDDLAVLYLATVQAIAHGTKHIIDVMNEHGYRINTVLACGGGTKNRVFLREHADITGCRIVLPKEPESVLLGSAMLGATAAGVFPDLIAAMGAMSAADEIIQPGRGEIANYHCAKHQVFQRMHSDQLTYRTLMNNGRMKAEG